MFILDPPSPVKTVGDLLFYAVLSVLLWLLFMMFAVLFSFTSLTRWMPAVLRSVLGGLIGSLVAIVIIGLEQAVIGRVFFGMRFYDASEVWVYIWFGVACGGGLVVALAWLSESFDRELSLVKHHDESEVE